jgi:hypothetical protein
MSKSFDGARSRAAEEREGPKYSDLKAIGHGFPEQLPILLRICRADPRRRKATCPAIPSEIQEPLRHHEAFGGIWD